MPLGNLLDVLAVLEMGHPVVLTYPIPNSHSKPSALVSQLSEKGPLMKRGTEGHMRGGRSSGLGRRRSFSSSTMTALLVSFSHID